MQEIVNVRIDDRLIHGQVAAVWSQYTKATRIMVVDDQVVHEDVYKRQIHTHDSGRVLGPYGYAVPTPNLEAFAKQAAVCLLYTSRCV